MRNLVFIGMIGSETKSIAESAANKLNRKFVDTDEVITRNIGMTLHDFYTLFPLDSFNDITFRLANQLADGEDYVIAVGDCILINPDAMKALKKTGYLVYIDQDIESIISNCTDSSHPLLARGIIRLYELFAERESMFSEYCDINITLSENSLEEILRHYSNAPGIDNEFDPALYAFFRYYIEKVYPSANSESFAEECACVINEILEKYKSGE